MSTDIATIPDALEGTYAVAVWSGVGGIAIFCHEVATGRGVKVWLDATGVEALAEALAVARSYLEPRRPWNQPGKEP